MLTRPADFPDEVVSEMIRDGWGIHADAVEYRPVGFGSDHWIATTASGRRWFVTVDFGDGASIRELRAALTVARELADDGMTGVIAPLRGADGAILRTSERGGRAFAVSVFPVVDGHRLDEVREPDHSAVIRLLAQLHSRTDAVRAVAHDDDLGIPKRAALLPLLDTVAAPWNTGPYGEPARQLILTSEHAIRAALDAYDRLTRSIDRSGWVVTHGEPHDRNILVTASGPALIDWDTARIAPAARDLWHVSDGALVGEYRELTGRQVSEEDIEFYRLRWDLGEVAQYVAEFASPHVASANTAEGFGGLRESVERLLTH